MKRELFTRLEKIKEEVLRPVNGATSMQIYLLFFKRCFEKGWNLTSYVKYVIALFGIASSNIDATIWLGVVYAFLCVVLGFVWYLYDLERIDAELGNRFNDFVKEMREAVKKTKE